MSPTPPLLQGPGWLESVHMLAWPDASDLPAGCSPAILSRPAHGRPDARTSMLILSGGAQARAGAHRQWVLMARHLAGHGHTVLRFDWPGLGDASGSPRPFESNAPVVHAALQLLLKLAPHAQRTLLLGLCDGASSALLSLRIPPPCTIDGLVLINPWVRSEHSLARVHVQHYYRRRLLDPDFWRKLASGQIGSRSLLELGRKLAQMHQRGASSMRFQDQMAHAWRAHAGRILLLTSELDLTGQEFLTHARHDQAWRGALQHPGLDARVLSQADHTCASEAAQQALLAQVSTWLSGFNAASEPAEQM
jgi:uncharacterized protein